jgi:hypothetical protein
MKHCPQCQQFYEDDGEFCVSDGSLLVLVGSPSQSRVVVSWDDGPPGGEVPTQYVSIPQQPTHAPPASSSNPPNWLYGLIGGLVAVILMGAVYLVFIAPHERDSEKARAENSTTPANSSVSNAMNGTINNPGANQNSFLSSSTTPAKNTAANAIPNAARPAANAANAAANSVYSNPVAEKHFRRTFAGTVDNDGIEMYLERNGSSLTGKVNPNNHNAVIYVEGYIQNDGSFQMDEKSDIGVVTGVYRGRFNGDGTVNGTWSKPGGEKTRPMFLRRQ